MSLISVTGPARPVLDTLTARVDGIETGSVSGWKGPYDTVAAGIAATVSGDVFYTATTDAIAIYRNDNGVAAELTSIMGSTAVSTAIGEVAETVTAETASRQSDTAQRIRWCATRAEAVSIATTGAWAIGAQIAWGDSIYCYDGTSSLILDMPGWMPVVVPSITAYGSLDAASIHATFARAAASGRAVTVPAGD